MMTDDLEQMGPVDRPLRQLPLRRPPDARGIVWFQGPANAGQDKIELRGMNAFARKHIVFNQIRKNVPDDICMTDAVKRKFENRTG